METTRPLTTNGTAVPTEVVCKAKRRRFSASYKLRLLKEADACVKPGEVRAPLRREGIFSSHLAQWRKQRERGSLYGSTQAGKELLAKDEDIRRLRKDLNQCRRQLEKAEAIIEVQKKSVHCLASAARPRPGSHEGDTSGTASGHGHE